jgi:hypothetical protein
MYRTWVQCDLCVIVNQLEENFISLTGSRVSGVTPHRSSHLTYASPNEPFGYCANLAMSTVWELTRGLSLSILRPSALRSIVSRRRGKLGPAVVSPSAATISTCICIFFLYEYYLTMRGYIPWRRGLASAITAEPTARNAFSNNVNGTWPSYAGWLLNERVCLGFVTRRASGRRIWFNFCIWSVRHVFGNL